MTYIIYKEANNWYVVRDESGRLMWVEKSIEKCKEAIENGLVDKMASLSTK